jgi:hypothetical protein
MGGMIDSALKAIGGRQKKGLDFLADLKGWCPAGMSINALQYIMDFRAPGLCIPAGIT